MYFLYENVSHRTETKWWKSEPEEVRTIGSGFLEDLKRG